MTTTSMPVIADSDRPCPTYAWCELNHSDPDIIKHAPDTHEKHVTLEAGDARERFLLELRDGIPRIEVALDVEEIWREPSEQTDSLRNLSEVLAAASALYDEFVKSLEPNLKRPHAVTHELADRDV